MQQQTQTDDFLIAFTIGAKQAHELQQPRLRGLALLQIAVRDYHQARQSLNLDLHEYLRGWSCGWHAYLDGIIDEKALV